MMISFALSHLVLTRRMFLHKLLLRCLCPLGCASTHHTRIRKSFRLEYKWHRNFSSWWMVWSLGFLGYHWVGRKILWSIPFNSSLIELYTCNHISCRLSEISGTNHLSPSSLTSTLRIAPLSSEQHSKCIHTNRNNYDIRLNLLICLGCSHVRIYQSYS